MNLEQLLNVKDLQHRSTVTATPDDTIAGAISKMVEHDMGALPVCNDKEELIGIVTERDIVRKCYSGSEDCSRYKVKDVMSRKVAVGNAGDDLDYAINVMKTENIRHLPVVDGTRVIGMISIKDLLGFKLEQTRTEIRFLSEYISGGS
jgi:CBS domain-containing protein